MLDKTIHVRNLDYRADEGAIAEYFGECGELADLRLGRDVETGRSRGFCKIAFKTKEGVDAAFRERPTKLLRTRYSSSDG